MTPKEKAKELIEKFDKHSMMYWSDITGWDKESGLENSKQCALICVDEILEYINRINTISSFKLSEKDWQEVKQEIEKI